MKKRNASGTAASGAIGGRIQFTPVQLTIIVLAIVAIFYCAPAHAAIWDPVVDILDESTVTFQDVVGGFLLLCGLVFAFVIGIKNFAAGVVTAIAVLAFASMVANNDTIANEIGFGAR